MEFGRYSLPLTIAGLVTLTLASVLIWLMLVSPSLSRARWTAATSPWWRGTRARTSIGPEAARAVSLKKVTESKGQKGRKGQKGQKV